LVIHHWFSVAVDKPGALTIRVLECNLPKDLQGVQAGTGFEKPGSLLQVGLQSGLFFLKQI
jgi:hypothetical protein